MRHLIVMALICLVCSDVTYAGLFDKPENHRELSRKGNFNRIHSRESKSACHSSELKSGNYTFEYLNNSTGERRFYDFEIVETEYSCHEIDMYGDALETDFIGAVMELVSDTDDVDDLKYVSLGKDKTTGLPTISFFEGVLDGSKLKVGSIETGSIIQAKDGDFLVGYNPGSTDVWLTFYKNENSTVLVPNEVKSVADKYFDAVQSGDYSATNEIFASKFCKGYMKRMTTSLQKMNTRWYRTASLDEEEAIVFFYLIERGQTHTIEIILEKNSIGEFMIVEMD